MAAPAYIVEAALVLYSARLLSETRYAKVANGWLSIDEALRLQHIARYAYREGYRAFEIEQDPPESNPYAEGSEARQLWDEGYAEAEAEFVRENL